MALSHLEISRDEMTQAIFRPVLTPNTIFFQGYVRKKCFCATRALNQEKYKDQSHKEGL